MRIRLRKRMTMLELVQCLQRVAASDEDVVVRAKRLIRAGRVMLSGSFSGSRI